MWGCALPAERMLAEAWTGIFESTHAKTVEALKLEGKKQIRSVTSTEQWTSDQEEIETEKRIWKLQHLNNEYTEQSYRKNKESAKKSTKNQQKQIGDQIASPNSLADSCSFVTPAFLFHAHVPQSL